MTIKVFKDLKMYALESSLTNEDIQLVKKYRPAALKIKDENNNDMFAISYNEGHGCVSGVGATFGATSDAGNIMIVSAIPEGTPSDKYGEVIADKVGAAVSYIDSLEKSIAAEVAKIKAQRGELISSLIEV